MANEALSELAETQQALPGRPLILTPHPGEMARLLGRTSAGVQADRRQAAEECARLTRAIVILKGAGTLVSDGRRLYRNATGNPGLATGGTIRGGTPT